MGGVSGLHSLLLKAGWFPVAPSSSIRSWEFRVDSYDCCDVLNGNGAEQFLFTMWKTPAYVCLDAFVYHIKAATLVTKANGKRGVVSA
jgi:hypothetical protein